VPQGAGQPSIFSAGTTTTEAAAPFAVFERCALVGRYPGDFPSRSTEPTACPRGFFGQTRPGPHAMFIRHRRPMSICDNNSPCPHFIAITAQATCTILRPVATTAGINLKMGQPRLRHERRTYKARRAGAFVQTVHTQTPILPEHFRPLSPLLAAALKPLLTTLDCSTYGHCTYDPIRTESHR